MPGVPVLESCPLCGASAGAATRCGACGTVLGERPQAWSQPAFERVWEAREPPDGPVGVATGAVTGGVGGGALRLAGAWGHIRRIVGAAGQTAFAIVLRPEASFRSFRPGGGFLKPTVYALLLGGPSLLLGIFLAVRLEGESMAAAGLGPAAALGLLILAPPLYVYLRAQLLQLALLFAGLARGSFESTFRLVSYANASVAPLLVLPFAGDFLFLITGAILESIALRHVHGLTVGRALLAEVLPATVLGVVLLAAGAIGLLWWSQTQG